MPIRSGIGIGEAQIYDTSRLANQYVKQVYNENLRLQKQALENQKKNEKWLEDLATTVSSAKTLGNDLNPKDAQAIIDHKSKIRDLYNQAANAKTDADRIRLKAEIDKGFDDANIYANKAKAFRKSVDNLGHTMVDLYPEDFTQEDKDKIISLSSGSFNDAAKLGYETIDLGMFKRKPNDAPLLKAYDDLDKFIKQNAGRDVKDITTETIIDNKTGLKLYRPVKKVNPELVRSHLLTNIKANDGLKYNLKINYQKQNPDLIPTDENLTDFFISEAKKAKGDNWNVVYGDTQNIPKEPKAPESEIKQAKLIKDRVGGIKSLIEKKDQSTFEALKGSLPPGSNLKWLTANGKVFGVRFDIPKTYDDLGGTLSEMKQDVDFTKGDPYKTINTIMNRYYGKKVSNEDLQGAGVAGNTSIPTHTRQEFKKAGWSDAEIVEAVKLGKIKVK